MCSVTPNILFSVKAVTIARSLYRFHYTAQYSPREKCIYIQRNVCPSAWKRKSLDEQGSPRIEDRLYFCQPSSVVLVVPFPSSRVGFILGIFSFFSLCAEASDLWSSAWLLLLPVIDFKRDCCFTFNFHSLAAW